MINSLNSDAKFSTADINKKIQDWIKNNNTDADTIELFKQISQEFYVAFSKEPHNFSEEMLSAFNSRIYLSLIEKLDISKTMIEEYGPSHFKTALLQFLLTKRPVESAESRLGSLNLALLQEIMTQCEDVKQDTAMNLS